MTANDELNNARPAETADAPWFGYVIDAAIDESKGGLSGFQHSETAQSRRERLIEAAAFALFHESLRDARLWDDTAIRKHFRVEAERDEVRAEVERLRAELVRARDDAAMRQCVMIEAHADLCRVFDEARAEAERLTPCVLAFSREEQRADKLGGEADDLRQDLDDARNGWEACAKTLRQTEAERDDLSARMAVAAEALRFLDQAIWGDAQIIERAGEWRGRIASVLTDLPARATAMLRVVEAAVSYCRGKTPRHEFMRVVRAFAAIGAIGGEK